MIVVPVIVGRRAGSAVEVDVGASAASVVVDEDPLPGHATVATKAPSVAEARCSSRGRRIIRGALVTQASPSGPSPTRIFYDATPAAGCPAPPQNSFTNRSRRSSMSCSIRAKVFWKNDSTSLP